MLNVLFAVASLVGLVTISAIILSFMEFRKEIRVLNESLRTIEASLSPAIKHFSEAAEEITELIKGVNQIKDDIQTVTGAGRELASEIDKISHLLSSTTLKTRASVEGLKAGLWVAAKVLKANFLKKEAPENEL